MVASLSRTPAASPKGDSAISPLVLIDSSLITVCVPRGPNIAVPVTLPDPAVTVTPVMLTLGGAAETAVGRAIVATTPNATSGRARLIAGTPSMEAGNPYRRVLF